jgi:hypothetical protein
MKTKVTKEELKECVKNAFERVVAEGYDKEWATEKRKRDDEYKRKTSKHKHGKMEPVKKPKYKDNWD